MCSTLDTEPYDIDHKTGEPLTAEDVIEQKDEEIVRLKEEVKQLRDAVRTYSEQIMDSERRTRQQAETLQALYLDKYDQYRSQRKSAVSSASVHLYMDAALTRQWLEGFYLATNRTGFQIVAQHNLDLS